MPSNRSSRRKVTPFTPPADTHRQAGHRFKSRIQVPIYLGNVRSQPQPCSKAARTGDPRAAYGGPGQIGDLRRSWFGGKMR